MTFWTGNNTPTADRRNSSTHKLEYIDQFFAVLVRLKVGIFVQDVSDRFNISVGTFSKYFTSWICLLFEELRILNPFPSRLMIDRTMPNCFKKYKNLRIIIDCTEIFIQRSSSLVNQNLTFSNYKHHNTLKFLIGITPSGVIPLFQMLGVGGYLIDRLLLIQVYFPFWNLVTVSWQIKVLQLKIYWKINVVIWIFHLDSFEMRIGNQIF